MLVMALTRGNRRFYEMLLRLKVDDEIKIGATDYLIVKEDDILGIIR